MMMFRSAAVVIFLSAAAHAFVPAAHRPSFIAPTGLGLSSQQQTQEQDLKAIFGANSSSDGTMSKAGLMKVPAIAELLSEGDLLESEVNAFWERTTSEDFISAKLFQQIYRDIDNLFEPAEEEPEEEENMNESLGKIFEKLSDDKGMLTMEALREWSEIKQLVQDGLLGEDEIQKLFTEANAGSADFRLDLAGWMKFNDKLDDLFVMDDDDEAPTSAPSTIAEPKQQQQQQQVSKESPLDTAPPRAPVTRTMVQGDDLPPGVLFANLCSSSGVLTMKDLKYWSELGEMLKDEDLMPAELRSMFSANANKKGEMSKAGFVKFCQAIDDLFEEDDDSDSDVNEAKGALLDVIGEINAIEDRLPCGLETDDEEVELVQNIVKVLESDATLNRIKTAEGDIEPQELVGNWELLYSSSSSMKFNQGLSGLSGSIPNGKFGGLTQKLSFSKFMQDVEYIEQVDVTPSSASFQVKVNGAWALRKSVSLFTNQPCTMLSIEPDRIDYKIQSMRADHWKTLGPLNMLDVTYLDDELRIMRGNTATDAIFVFKRIE